jgi:glycerol-3-phosphate dehydrogenase (NAD(P)+)
MSYPTGVVGAGSWGTTLAKILGDNGHQTRVWAYEEEVCQEINEQHENSRYVPGARLAECVTATNDIQQVCESCPLMLMVVPSHVFRRVANQMGDHLNGEQIVVHCTKGIEQGSFKRMSEVLREETCLRKIGVLSGPNLSRELAKQNPAGTLVASPYDEVVARAQEVLHNQYFRVYGGSDVVGAEVGGAFKNIIALAAGIVDGLKMGDNTKALLLTRGLSEMARFGVTMGAEVLTFGGMAGIGDLMATCASPLSRNHQVGERLAGGETLEQIQESMFMVAEGVKTTKPAYNYARDRGMSLPIVEAVHALLYEGAEVRDAIQMLMDRDVGREFLDISDQQKNLMANSLQ